MNSSEAGRRHSSKATTAPIANQLLTLREAAGVLRLSTRTVREYVHRGEIEGLIIGAGGDSGMQTLTLSLRMHPVTGISLERTATGIRRWISETRGADGMATSSVSGRGSTAEHARHPGMACAEQSQRSAQNPLSVDLEGRETQRRNQGSCAAGALC